MNIVIKPMRIAIMAALFAGFSFVVQAQEVTPEHTEAAKAAMAATGTTSRLDKILPEVANLTKTGLIGNRPDIETEISAIVDEVAIGLAERRGDLETEVAAIYSKMFTLEELKVVEAFFASDTGIKFLNLTPALFGQVDEMSNVWRRGITRDMGQAVKDKMKEAGIE